MGEGRGNNWVKTNKSILETFTGNPGIKWIPSDMTKVSEVFFEDKFLKILYGETNVKINIPMAQQLTGVQVCNQTAGLSSICPQTEMKDYPASLRWCVFSKSCLPVIVDFLDWDYNGYPNSSWRWVGTNPIHSPKITSPQGSSRGSKQHALNLKVTGMGIIKLFIRKCVKMEYR